MNLQHALMSHYALVMVRVGSVSIFQLRFGFQSQVLGFVFIWFLYSHITAMQEYPAVKTLRRSRYTSMLTPQHSVWSDEWSQVGT